MEIREFTSRLKKIKRQGDGFLACCPAHEDKTPSLSIKTGKYGQILLHCFAGCDYQSILLAMNLSEQDLLPTRKRTKQSILEKTYQYRNENGENLFEVCRYNPKDFRIRRTKNNKIIWNLGNEQLVLYRLPEILQAIKNNEKIYICEGEKDADLLATLGLASTSTPLGAGKWREDYAKWLTTASEVVIIPDYDNVGQKHALTIAQDLPNSVIIDLHELDANLPLKSDISDFLQNHELQQLLLAPTYNYEEYSKIHKTQNENDYTTLFDYINNKFPKIIKKKESTIITGFPSLDKLLYNTLPAGLYVIGAISSLGKSAFCTQLCDTFAEQQQNILYFTLEMSQHEMAARTLARIIFQQTQSEDITTGSILRGETEITNITLHKINSFAKYITYIQGNFNMTVSQIRKICENFDKTPPPIVFIDYLQIITPNNSRMSDKQSIDYNVVELKRMSRDLNMPVIVISSLNRQNYNYNINFAAFKESGAIEYSADFVMGLQAAGISDIMETTDEKKWACKISQAVKKTMSEVPRNLELVVLKNRRGEAMGRIKLKYWPGQNWFEE